MTTKKRKSKIGKGWALALLSASLLTAAVGVLHLISLQNAAFADALNLTLGNATRVVLAAVSALVPFSAAEWLLLMAPAFLAVYIGACVYYRKNGVMLRRLLAFLLMLAMLVYLLFALTLGFAYQGTGLDEKMGLSRQNPTADELESVALLLVEKANRLASELAFRDGGATRMPITYEDMNEKLSLSFATLSGKYAFLPTMRGTPKPVHFSREMSYLHITGVYTYLTGEANLNVYFPDFILPYTAAHEMAHQRGIAREDEANFIAYLACISSADPYVQYSGYMNMLTYVCNALYSAAPARYTAVSWLFSDEVKAEYVAYSDFYDQFRDSKVGEISRQINDVYLQSQGTQGTKSYGLVVDLAVAYYKTA